MVTLRTQPPTLEPLGNKPHPHCSTWVRSEFFGGGGSTCICICICMHIYACACGNGMGVAGAGWGLLGRGGGGGDVPMRGVITKAFFFYYLPLCLREALSLNLESTI